MAVAARNKVWFLRNARDVARQLPPEGTHDACLLTRSAHVTGEIQAHEMAFAGRRAVDRQHAVLVPLHARSRLQFRAAVAAAVHQGLGCRRTAAT